MGGYRRALAGKESALEGSSMSDFVGKTFFLTGGSSGLGLVCARQLAERGARLVLAGRQIETLREEFPADTHLAVACDVTDEAAIKDLVAQLKSAQINLNGVVLSAGIHEPRPLAMETKASLERTWLVNVYGSLGLLAALLKTRLVAREASIVLFSSAATHAGGIGNVSYAASKGAMEGTVRCLAMELAPQKIRTNAIAPGVIPTPMSSRYLSRMTEQQVQGLTHEHPLGLGTPEDVARLVTFLLSDDSKWMTGAVLPIDGGLTSH